MGNMKYIILLACLYCAPLFSEVSSGTAYLQRFMNYLQWHENLPQKPDPAFLTFINEQSPLAKKLREKWLYYLASNKDWDNFSKYYQYSTDLNLQCFNDFALYNQGKTAEALDDAKKIWLSPHIQPPGCNQLFKLLQNSNLFNDDLISQRVILALANNNINLANYLLSLYKVPRRSDQKLLLSIHQNPYRIILMGPGLLHDYFYLYGLKQLVVTNMSKAIEYWGKSKTHAILSHAQKQEFIAYLALYKAKRDQEDAAFWFSQLESHYYNDELLDWQIRFALKRQKWQKVEKLINFYQDKENPCWQYWLARSLEAQKKQAEATAIYNSLAKTRHYYGFLASQRLKAAPHFQNESQSHELARLKPYQPFMNNIRNLYRSKQKLKASRLLNDFTSELSKEDKIALLYWLTEELQWHAKAVFLSDNEDLSNQLSLRFPLAYNQNINKHAKNYEIPAAFIYAIIRQESGFREDIVSSAGARGLMQLMPNTARQVAKMSRIPYQHQDQLFLSQQNINIGIAYLNALAKQFSHHPILMAAAYNAGPRQVIYWLKNYPPKQMDIWIETLPYQETRNYLKNVIAFYTVYEYRMQKQAHIDNIMKPL
jgi:soluble lytic murein transglycosylase